MRAQGFTNRFESERGIALITTLLVMMLMSALLVGFTTLVMSDQRYRLIDRDRVRSFYAAQSGLEKLNTDLTKLFLANVAPTDQQISQLADNPPDIDSVEFVDDGSSASYGVTEDPPPDHECTDPCARTISTGPYAGLIALIKTYRLDATARTADGGETHLMRRMETVTIPVFQFGMFSDMDLSFHAGPTFDFGGRVHTNGNLFLAQGNGNTLWLRQRVTALKEVVRKQLANGVAIATSPHLGTVRMAKAAGSTDVLLDTEGSVTDGPPLPTNDQWTTISLTKFNSYIRTGLTGAKPLNLPLLTTGGTNADLIRRPVVNESQDLLESRYFNNVSLRILLSDRETDIMSLPTVVQSSNPVSLDGNWRTTPPAGYNGGAGVDGTHAPIARSPGRLLAPGGIVPVVTAVVPTGGTQNVNVTNFPTDFRITPAAAPAGGFLLRVVKVGTAGSPWTVTCSGKTVNSFTDCSAPTRPAANVNGVTISMVLPNNTIPLPVTLAANWASLNWATTRSTLTLTAGNTDNYASNLFPVTVRKGANTYRALCSGKDQTHFVGCVADPTAPNGSPAASVNTPGVTYDLSYSSGFDGAANVTNQGVTANWAWSTTTLAPTSLTVASTMPYTTSTFWVINPASNVLVTCTGFQLQPVLPHQLTGCNVGTQLEANATIESGALSAAGTALIGGFIKIEMQDTNTQWRDVTMEILNHGIGAPNLSGGRTCDPSPNAIVRLQRLRDNAEAGTGTCSYAGTQLTTDFIPNTIFDTREALYRDTAPGGGDPLLGGVMHYVTLDVRNLSLWLQGLAPYNGGSGQSALNNEGRGFSVYFSDRRNNRNTGGNETGEFGFEDIINPGAANGVPNGGVPDAGEDVNASAGNVETYGATPAYYNAAGVFSAQPPGALAPLTSAAGPQTAVRAPYAMVNRAILFRRALKLTNGALGNIVRPGLTVSAENPIYVQGHWNADAANALGSNEDLTSATSIVADAVTLLSTAWNDWNSFRFPYAPGSRPRSQDSYYRFAVIAGKNIAFKRSTVIDATPTDFGSDGGAHNFLRMLEAGGSNSVHYRGSIASFFYSRQAVGIYKCCTTVYGAPPGYGAVPGRNYFFDTNFLNPARLPPLTPVFRDTNSLGFAQEVRPGK